MKTITVSALGWNTILDFYEAILGALQAPEWHGTNANALIDSMVYGSINGVEPPFRLDIIEMSTLPLPLKMAVAEEVGWVLQARDESSLPTRPQFDILLHEGVQ